MKRRVISILSILLIFLFSSIALSQDVREEEKENRASSELEVLSPNKVEVIESKVVKAVPVLRSAKEEKILEDLKEARHAGDRAGARALQLELDELHGILPNAPRPADDEQEEASFEEPSQVPDFRWVDGDIRINDPSYDVVKPAMASASNGDLYVAMEDRDTEVIGVYKSTDNGATWSSFLTLFSLGNDNRNPSIAVTEDYVHVAYEVWYSDTNRAVRIYSKPTDFSSGHGAWVVQNISDTPDFICPEICTDSLEFPGETYVYVTYAVRTPYPWYYLVYFSRSEDNGQTFSAPLNVTGGTAYTAWATKPDIAFGTNSDALFIAFVKPGLLGSGWADEVVYVTKSTNYGDSWDTPVQLTDVKKSYHPRVSAAQRRNSVVVAYTYEYSSTDDDVRYYYSTDAGSTWNGSYPLANSTDDEHSAALSVSNYQGRFHAAYYRNHDIYYRSSDTATPTIWSSAQLINELNYASGTYSRPTITVNPTMSVADEACIAWSDYRNTNYAIYFDAAYIVGVPPGDELAVDFGTNGLWHYSGSSWTHLAAWNPNYMEAYGTGLAIDFDSNGLWNYDGSSWTHLAAWDPTTMEEWAGGLAVDFSVNGLWSYNGSSWTNLAAWNPGTMEEWAGGLAVDFSANGLWSYNGSSWTNLAAWDPGYMEAYGSGLAIDFHANGLWNYDGSSWTHLSAWNPGPMEEWAGGLAVDFGANGLWSYNGSSWTNLAAWNPGYMEAYGTGLAIDFGANGLWNYDGSSWTNLAAWDPGPMAEWAGGLAVDFGANGLWSYNGSSWTNLAAWNPEDIIAIDLY